MQIFELIHNKNHIFLVHQYCSFCMRKRISLCNMSMYNLGKYRKHKKWGIRLCTQLFLPNCTRRRFIFSVLLNKMQWCIGSNALWKSTMDHEVKKSDPSMVSSQVPTYALYCVMYSGSNYLCTDGIIVIVINL